MSKTDDMEEAKRKMREAIEEARQERKYAMRQRIDEDIIPHNPNSRVEAIAHSKWITKLQLDGRTQKQIDNPSSKDRSLFHKILEEVKLDYIKLFW